MTPASDHHHRTARVVCAVLLAILVVGAVAGASATATTAPERSAESAAPRWVWPVPPPHPVVTEFEAPDQVWSPGHRGIDIEAAAGSVVLAPEAGVVHFAGVVVDRPVLSIEHDGGVLSSFEPVEATVAKGDVVGPGQEIGILVPGHCSGDSCLHLGGRVDGDYVSPLLFLGGATHAVLLPTRPLE